MSDDEWVTGAMSDDAVVVQLLLELKGADERTSPHASLVEVHPPLKWTVRQRRSKQLLQRKKSARASPTTPLSWSGGTSGNGCGAAAAAAAAADGFEESSERRTGEELRSKVALTNGTPTSKRSRRKKHTLAELKEEESLLSKERKNLKNQLARLRLYLEQERYANERLKRMKLDLFSRHMPDDVMAPAKYEEANFDSLQKIKVASDPKISVSTTSITDERAATNLSFQTEEIEIRKPSLLPDLNLPVEDDLGGDFLYGLS